MTGSREGSEGTGERETSSLAQLGGAGRRGSSTSLSDVMNIVPEARAEIITRKVLGLTREQGEGPFTPEIALGFRDQISRPLAAFFHASSETPKDIGIARHLRNQLLVIQKTLSEEVARLPLGQGIRRVIEWLNSMADTPEGAFVLEKLPLHTLLDLRVPAVVFGIMLHGAKEGLGHQDRLAVVEDMVGENGTCSEDDLKQLFTRLYQTRMTPKSRLEHDVCFKVLATQLLMAVICPIERRADGRFEGRGNTITGLITAELEEELDKEEGLDEERFNEGGFNEGVTLRQIKESDHSTTESPRLELLFRGITPETVSVLTAMLHVNPDFYNKVVKWMISTCNAYEVRVNGKMPRFRAWDTGARALQLLMQIVFKDELHATPDEIRRDTGEATRLALRNAGLGDEFLKQLAPPPVSAPTPSPSALPEEEPSEDPFADLDRMLAGLFERGREREDED